MKKLIYFLLIFCFLFVSCDNTDIPDEPVKEEEKYVPTDTILSFSDENAGKVITESTYDISQYTNNAGTDIKPYQLFSDGMCLQRDAVNRIWGKASKTSFIAAQINGKVYYGTVNGREWEIYLPKMNAGGPYDLTIISELGRFKIKNVYIGEVYFLGGQSNMEWQPQHSGDVLKDLYETDDCVNNQIRMLHIPYYAQSEPTNEVVNTIKWNGANKTTIPVFTAVGYLFGKQMQEELGCPVGLIAAPVGGSNIEF
jgi:sialate O-acetylesterase